MAGRDPDALTAREQEVLALLRLGLTNEEIAERLGISLDGAKYHVSQILSKLGVATREEAAEAGMPRPRGGAPRRWWAAWPLAAKAAAAALMVAAVAGLGVLAWGVLETSGDGEESVATRLTARATVPASPSAASHGLSADSDPNNFNAFAAQLARAVDASDVEWMIDHTLMELDCDQLNLMSLPEGCEFAPPGTKVPGVVRGFLQSEGDAITPAQYAELITAFFTGWEQEAQDEFGQAKPRLYSFGVRTATLGGPLAGEDRVEAIATSISNGSPYGLQFEQARRLVLELHTVYDAQGWHIEWVSLGGDPDSLALDLDAFGAGSEVDTDGEVWQFWRRWEDGSPTP